MYGINLYIMRAALFWGGFLLFLMLEWLKPYRIPTVPKVKRLGINVPLVILNSIVLNIIFASSILRASGYVSARQYGVLNIVYLPPWAKLLAAVIFMDFVLYVWHLLNHVVPFFWRFHRVHHSDLNMDVSTATRFHIGELSISSIIRLALILFTGVDIVTVILFESILELSAQFQHSSLTVSSRFEKIYWLLFVPPSMHRIHHSVIVKERDTNYGTIFSVWDRMFGTLLRNIDQDRIVIGMGAYRDPQRLKLHHLFLMPFTPRVK